MRELLSPEASQNTSCQEGGEGDQEQIDTEVKNTGQIVPDTVKCPSEYSGRNGEEEIQVFLSEDESRGK